MKKNSKIVAEISAGELLDKISILEIKLEKIKSEESKVEINKEYKMLKMILKENVELTEDLTNLSKEIKAVNLTLWNIEDELRKCEKNKDFSKTFIELARAVYFNNDKRAKIKSKIYSMLGSNIREVKHYVDY